MLGEVLHNRTPSLTKAMTHIHICVYIGLSSGEA